MSKFVHIAIFSIVFIFLFGLLAIPSLANNPQSIASPKKYVERDFSTFSAQLTFTPVATIYLSIVLGPAQTSQTSNDLVITELVPSGNNEYIEIRNNGPDSQSMDGWQIISVVGSQTFDFPTGLILGVGQTLRVHSGSSATNNPPTNLQWTTAFIWLNSGDKAELRDASGVLRDTECYDDGCP